MILYEYPLNERVRILLRLEDLFERLDYFAAGEHPLEHHVAIMTLFDILDIAGRADLKSDLLQELDRQRQALAQYRTTPGVSLDTLERILAQIENAWAGLNATTGRTGQHLRDNDWLMSIRSRAIIAGGACEFDLPSYHAWQHRPAEARRQEIAAWAAPFRPLHDSLTIVLRLLRENAQRIALTAQPGGGFQQQMGGKAYQMVQVRLDPALGAIPEISANKYLLWIRFTSQDGDLRPRPFEHAVDFELALCNL
ncbi:cell division protein ZapD [Quisquiliibacterium transsilvanicum]|uniref:Cell division protein ZapD n=1 Tax=Quisquiliibacterium transsilvanicum TaxID=1549638 RepID=A0A7W8HGV7_9BURK|nr:cell division protein ZapD [Quisquiliibacterium transsilvanicum]MBB5271760.1 cell division protein ZapD [Quisquiliibacterium transsilvanicum]